MRHTWSVKLRGPLEDGEYGGFGRSSRWGFALEVVQDASDDGGVDHEGEELHFSPASRTGQRVDLVDTVNELGPSLAPSASFLGSFLDAFRLVYGRVVGSDGLGTNAVGVSTVESDEMFVGLGDVDEHPSEKFERVGQSLIVEFVSGLGLKDEQSGVAVEAQSREVDGRSHEVARQLVQPLGIIGIDRGSIVDANSTKGAGRCALGK